VRVQQDERGYAKDRKHVASHSGEDELQWPPVHQNNQARGDSEKDKEAYVIKRPETAAGLKKNHHSEDEQKCRQGTQDSREHGISESAGSHENQSNEYQFD